MSKTEIVNINTYDAVLRNIRIAPRKARLVADAVRGKLVSNALDSLRFMDKKAARIIYKLVNSAVSNATYNGTVDVDRLVVREIFVDGGAMWKRYIPRAKGSAAPIVKRTSHITVKLFEL